MREYDAKIPDDIKKEVNTDMNALRDILKNEKSTPEEIKKATETLSTHAQKIGEVIYKAAGEEGKGDTAKKENVVDAEVVDEKEKK